MFLFSKFWVKFPKNILTQKKSALSKSFAVSQKKKYKIVTVPKLSYFFKFEIILTFQNMSLSSKHFLTVYQCFPFVQMFCPHFVQISICKKLSSLSKRFPTFLKSPHFPKIKKNPRHFFKKCPRFVTATFHTMSSFSKRCPCLPKNIPHVQNIFTFWNVLTDFHMCNSQRSLNLTLIKVLTFVCRWEVWCMNTIGRITALILMKTWRLLSNGVTVRHYKYSKRLFRLQCWRCVSLHATLRWQRPGWSPRSPTWPVKIWATRWTRWRNSSRGTRPLRSPPPRGKSASQHWSASPRYEKIWCGVVLCFQIEAN